jgi:hypothetical protein
VTAQVVAHLAAAVARVAHHRPGAPSILIYSCAVLYSWQIKRACLRCWESPFGNRPRQARISSQLCGWRVVSGYFPAHIRVWARHKKGVRHGAQHRPDD